MVSEKNKTKGTPSKKTTSKKTTAKKATSKKAPTKKKVSQKKGSVKSLSVSQHPKAIPILIILILLIVIVIITNAFYDKDVSDNRGKILVSGDDIKDIQDIKKIPEEQDKEKSTAKSTANKTEVSRDYKNNQESNAVSDREILIYLLRLNEKTEKLYLKSVKRKISNSDLVGGALKSLVAGPTSYEEKKGFVSAVPANMRIRSVNINGRTAEVDFSSAIEHSATGDILLQRIKQIVFTATQFEDIESIVIKINGKTRRSLGSDGFSINGPLRR